MLNMDRRKFLIGSSAVIIAAPAIVQLANIMKVRPIAELVHTGFIRFTVTNIEDGDRVALINKETGELYETVGINNKWVAVSARVHRSFL